MKKKKMKRKKGMRIKGMKREREGRSGGRKRKVGKKEKR